LAHTISHHAPQIAIAPHPAASGQRPAPREDGNGHPGTHLATPGPPAKNTYRNGRARRAAKSPLGRVPIRWDRHSHRRPKVLRKSPELSGGRPSGERTQNDRWVLIFYVNTSHYCLSSPLSDTHDPFYSLGFQRRRVNPALSFPLGRSFPLPLPLMTPPIATASGYPGGSGCGWARRVLAPPATTPVSEKKSA
jgi:hypothetical protein